MRSKRLFDRIEEIKISNLSKKYGDNFAVDDLNLDIRGGELLILIGGSGAGKTTALKMINRLIVPDSGHIEINGLNIADLNEVELRRNIGYVIQQIGLFPHMTVKDNIGLLPKIEKWKSGEITKKVEELLELVDLPPDYFINRYPKELSGGQQQRIGLARALVMDPPLLLMDEPFGALDPILRKQLQDEFLEIKKNIGRTIILVTHDINEAFKLGDRIGIMHDSKLIQTGTPEELIFNPKNSIVSGLVEADKKFRHIESMKVKDLVSPVLRKYYYESSQNCETALDNMIKDDIHIAIVMENGDYRGIVMRRELYPLKKTDTTLADQLTDLPVFSPEDDAMAALREIKKIKAPFGLSMDKGTVFGFLIPDEIMMRLI
ncbi:ATP-binding cassette domain-containing protein [Methanoplanus sp. FWC-SCC4]|uniref:Molybdate/tungstate import ATP-binding protein WtpC n=1 Tax=Methanochimaera problematica TaxID=2609417 RepID=A0AA97I2H0_9EURY|nr:ATP-binding cassette domain-containing protein [Methanoplanus sp. FWC-SCC4]WOF16260.1 ATP-binding cassette domain-containing protein [Methanoplanus sp. FWC-SCC4]